MRATFDIPNAPEAELRRSPAAALIGALAARSALRLSHFEHRLHLPPPLAWGALDRPDLAGVPRWEGGRLVEHKFQHFRADNAVGSFHPGHRAKWTAHELCHRLVGFAWAPDATPWFHVLAARLNEVLPVAVYYHFDEAGLRRCPRHAGGGPLFGLWCPACEAAALAGPDLEDPQAEAWRASGRAFVEAELAAVDRARRTGARAPHRQATLELESDGFAYVASHRTRLESSAFAGYLERFHGPETGWHRDLASLEARVRALTASLADGAPLPPAWTAGEDRWIAQDLGWRLIGVRLDSEGPVVAPLERLVDRLADRPGALGEVIAGYRELAARYYLPPAEEVFAVGYPLPEGLGRYAPQVAEGLAEICPHTESLLGDAFDGAVARFVAEEPPVRAPVARRFAAWLAQAEPGPVADVCAYEAATAHPWPSDPAADGFAGVPGADDRLRVADGVEVLRLGVDPRAVVDALEGLEDDAVELVEAPIALAVRRRAGGDVLVAELSLAAASALGRLSAEGPLPVQSLGLDLETRESLVALGLALPATYPLSASL